MKIQCDVCSRKEASIFCSADEAALCDLCDQKVHHANKLASKHERFSLIQPSPSHPPLCDICQEKKAIIFCQQDRAIMCRDCELPLHTTNEHTRKHNRFLLTGVKLSKIISDVKTDDVNSCDPDQVPDFKCVTKKPTSVSSDEMSSYSSPDHVFTNSSKEICCVDDQMVSGGSTSSISEYLIDMLPGWPFEDFILDSPFGFCKSGSENEIEGSEEMLSFLDVDIFDKKLTSSSSNKSENLGIWVPQAPIAAGTTIVFGESTNYQNQCGLVQVTKQQETSVISTKGNKKIKKNGGFAVPQITHSVGSKRIRPFW